MQCNKKGKGSGAINSFAKLCSPELGRQRETDKLPVSSGLQTNVFVCWFREICLNMNVRLDKKKKKT